MGFSIMTRFILSFFALGLLLLVNSCCTKPPIDEVDYNDLFVNIADNIIVPRYAEFQTELEELTESLDAYNGSDLSLEILQNQFKVTYHTWQKVSIFEFGPAAEYSALLRSNCNTFPTNSSKIEENITSTVYNLDFPSNYEAKGFPALDYLLFHTNAIDLHIELENENRLVYLRDCITDMQNRIEGVVIAWDSYRTTFIGAVGNDQNSSLSLFFNQYLYDYEKLKRDKFALPAGFATQFGIPLNADVTLVEAPYSHLSLDLMITNLESLEAIYLGVGEDGIDGVGIFEKLKEYNAQSTVVEGDLAEAIKEQFVICKAEISNFENDLATEIETNIDALQNASSELQKMVPMLKNDMRSYLSVTVTLTDSDGD
jgi:predicted lipoprotein